MSRLIDNNNVVIAVDDRNGNAVICPIAVGFFFRVNNHAITGCDAVGLFYGLAVSKNPSLLNR
jgi:hypothetical protein